MRACVHACVRACGYVHAGNRSSACSFLVSISQILGIVIPSTLMKIPVRMGVLIGVLMSCKG